MLNWLFRRNFWCVHLLFLSITAFLLAKVIATLLGYWAVKSLPNLPVVQIRKFNTKLDQEKDYELILSANLFNSRRETILLDDDLLDIDDENLEPGNWKDAMPSNLPLKLVSTMLSLDPFKSRAVIVNVANQTRKVVSVGECEPYIKKNDPSMETSLSPLAWEPERPCNDLGIAIVKRIEEFRVYIFNNRERRYEYLDLGSSVKRPVVKKVTETKDVSEGIRKVGEYSYQIEQKKFDQTLGDIGKILLDARAIPETDASGSIIGFRLSYIKEGSLFEKIGLKTDDLLTRVNGYELDNPQKAFELFGKLRLSNQFTLDIKRGSAPITLDYSVVP